MILVEVCGTMMITNFVNKGFLSPNLMKNKVTVYWYLYLN